ncbi:MAG: DUF2232 domain-containing protein, partial [Elusimicrobiota bacterium]|nr:DUF2232 domain-containing protein [Elusimicrobiota bacterium]
KEIPDLTVLRPDESLVWFLIAAAALYLSGRGEFNFLTAAGANGLIVLLFGYLVNGTGIFSLLAAKLGMGNFLKVVFLAALIIFFRGILILTAAGILDTWFNFRKYTKKADLEKS